MTKANCGHTATVGKFTTGIGYDSLGYSLCYECANESERFDFARADRYTAYISTPKPFTPLWRDMKLTTWPGGELARVTEHSVSGSGFCGSDVHRWWFTAPDGSRWYGQNAGPGMVINVRRLH